MGFKPIKLIKSILSEVLYKHEVHQYSVPNLLLKEAIKDSADFAKTNMSDAMMFFDHQGIWDYTISLISKQNKPGHILEFGVYQGTSINYFAKQLPKQVFFGFDSFEGLQEDWKGWSLRKGAFNLNGKLPEVESNVKLVKGWFNESLPTFIHSNPIEQLNCLHIDCDTYEATVCVFEELEKQIKPGTLILFDEYFGYRGWEQGEYKAFEELTKRANLKFKYLAFAKCQVLVEIL